MNKPSKIAIIGAGPAGTCLSIRLASAGFKVTLIEREKFPRQKLCGEFISPECQRHFVDLGVQRNMLAAGGKRLAETHFFAMNGRSVSIQSDWLNSGGLALSLSRSEMDRILLERGRALGVNVIEGARVVDSVLSDGHLREIRFRNAIGKIESLSAEMFVDATGRAAALSTLLERRGTNERSEHKRPRILAFKTHLTSVEMADRCEIYSFNGGYAGLSPIENGLFNLCVMIKADQAGVVGNSPDRIMRQLLFQNPQAEKVLLSAAPADRWLSVAISHFGLRRFSLVPNVFRVGDSAAFIDPFTGSGMLMAMDSAELLAECVVNGPNETSVINAAYQKCHYERFGRRLKICSAIRHVAFRPAIANLFVRSLALNVGLRRFLARLTRNTNPAVEK